MRRSSSWESVNGAALHRFLLQETLGLPEEAGLTHRVLSDPSLDWDAMSDLIRCSGLARGFAESLSQPLIQSNAPASFNEAIRQFAVTEALKLAVTQLALKKIRSHLEQLETHAVLLKGAALTVLSWIDQEPFPAKCPGDIDLWVPASAAAKLRESLVRDGFKEVSDHSVPPGHYHLEPVVFQGILIEIHTQIFEKTWDLPETEMLQNAIDLVGWAPLKALDPGAFLLHTSVHLSNHFYAFGLKTMWGQRFILSRVEAGRMELDWNALAAQASRLRDPRRFWVPLQIFAEDLAFDIPDSFFERSPGGRIQEHLKTLARNRLHLRDNRLPLFGRDRWVHESLVMGSPRAWIDTICQKLPRLCRRTLSKDSKGGKAS